MEIRSVRAEDEEAVKRFLSRIPEGDRTFFKEDVTDPDVVAFWCQRRSGVGRSLARRAVLSALELGRSKLVVEVIADQESTIALFRSVGFDPEALLEDQVRDQAGELHDLMILGLSVEESWASLQSTGIAEGLTG